MAVGTLDLPVTPETSSYGALVSCTAGLGLIAEGAGELRGE